MLAKFIEILGVKAEDMMERQRLNLGKIQTNLQTRTQETMELQQEFEMLEKMYAMAEKQKDEEEMSSLYAKMKDITNKRNKMSSNYDNSTKQAIGTTPSSAIAHNEISKSASYTSQLSSSIPQIAQYSE
jgi:uncharacterized coiled-coil DUF342 family protein